MITMKNCRMWMAALILCMVPPATAQVVTLSGFLHYQKVGKRKLEPKETLGAFVDRLGGVIRGEYERDGKRHVVNCVVDVYREDKSTRFWFDRDGAKAWNFELQDGDQIEIAEKLWIPADPIPQTKLKFAPARFLRQP